MIHGYMLAWIPGNLCFYTAEMYQIEKYKDAAKTWALYESPQFGCNQEIVVYKSWCWQQPKYLQGREPKTGAIALYAGPLIFDPQQFESLTADVTH